MTPYYQTNAPTIENLDNMLYLGAEEDRTPHQGIFEGCAGDLPANLQYLNETVTTRDVEKLLIAQYRFRDMGFETWQEFQNALANTWNREFPVFRQNITNAEEFTVIDDKETTTENIMDTASSQSNGQSVTKFSDTPNQFNTEAEGENGLTSITKGESTGNATTNAGRDRVVTVDKGGNAFERWLELSAKNRNIVYNFIDKFAWLFLSTYIITKRSTQYDRY